MSAKNWDRKSKIRKANPYIGTKGGHANFSVSSQIGNPQILGVIP
jgi:hypothetical protein